MLVIRQRSHVTEMLRKIINVLFIMMAADSIHAGQLSAAGILSCRPLRHFVVLKARDAVESHALLLPGSLQ